RGARRAAGRAEAQQKRAERRARSDLRKHERTPKETLVEKARGHYHRAFACCKAQLRDTPYLAKSRKRYGESG
ncbi:MAG TPA: hypothetical protein VIA18_20405, partial [Polyangia bacterium]|nr:hypothetical protein [Polyangia bacterium]